MPKLSPAEQVYIYDGLLHLILGPIVLFYSGNVALLFDIPVLAVSVFLIGFTLYGLVIVGLYRFASREMLQRVAMIGNLAFIVMLLLALAWGRPNLIGIIVIVLSIYTAISMLKTVRQIGRS